MEKLAVPSTLRPAERLVWDSLAAAAQRMRTLVPESVPGFILLSQTLMERNEAWARLAAEGLTKRHQAARWKRTR